MVGAVRTIGSIFVGNSKVVLVSTCDMIKV